LNDHQRLCVKITMIALSVWLITACGRGNANEPAAASPAATPTDAAVTAPEAAAPGTVGEGEAVDTEIPVITLEAADAFPSADTPMPAATLPLNTESTVTALEVAETTACDIESDLDLAGYPDLEGKMGCAEGPATFDPVAINEFGDSPETDRFMLWFSNDRLIYVLLPDGTWSIYDDTWDESQPEFLCNPFGGEPASPPLPRRGFGKLWCESMELQATLGPVPREERLCQHAVLQTFQTGKMLACFEDATIRYFRLHDDQTWSLDVQR
jgi:hypothetical protein